MATVWQNRIYIEFVHHISALSFPLSTILSFVETFGRSKSQSLSNRKCMQRIDEGKMNIFNSESFDYFSITFIISKTVYVGN
jgi:hypothetical protein